MAYETEYTLLEQVIQMLAANKDNKFSRVIETVVNEAMKLERAQALQAEPYERTNERTGYANGFKDKTLALATGKVLLKIPQVRGLEFYPSCRNVRKRCEYPPGFRYRRNLVWTRGQLLTG
jgi:transposase-like protein